MITTDSLIHQGRRRSMVRELSQRLNVNETVLQSIGNVPRHCFLNEGLQHLAYTDKPLPILAGQTISQPSTVAIQTTLLNCNKGDKVLEIGTGCGYQTAVLCALEYQVYSIERIKDLYTSAQFTLNQLNYNANLFYGDGYEGLPKYAPFKGILITCGAKEIPQKLLSQLAIGGTMVIPVGDKEQTMKKIIRKEDGSFMVKDFGTFNFVPMLDGTE